MPGEPEQKNVGDINALRLIAVGLAKSAAGALELVLDVLGKNQAIPGLVLVWRSCRNHERSHDSLLPMRVLWCIWYALHLGFFDDISKFTNTGPAQSCDEPGRQHSRHLILPACSFKDQFASGFVRGLDFYFWNRRTG